MKISAITSFNSNVSVNSISQCKTNKPSFGYGDYGFVVNPNPEDDCAEQKQTLWEGVKGAAYILALPITLPLGHLHDKMTGKIINYSDLDRLEAEYEPDDFDEHYDLDI